MVSRTLFLAAVVTVLVVVGSVDTVTAGTTNAEVTSTNDVDDGVCNVAHCSLREAMEVPASPGAVFDIPASDPGCSPVTHVCTIQVLSPLPPITGDFYDIDGLTQSFAVENTDPIASNAELKIELEMSAAVGATYGLQVLGDNAFIIGLVINGLQPGMVGIDLVGDHANVRGNYIGVTPEGSDIAVASIAAPAGLSDDQVGIRISGSSGNVVGGSDVERRNVISGHYIGVQIAGGTDNVVAGNLIGTDATGTSRLDNEIGVQVDSGSTENRIGGSGNERNVISGNFTGVLLDGVGVNYVQGNYIGTNAAGDEDVANADSAVDVFNSTDVRVGGLGELGNLLAGNHGAGAHVEGSTGTRLTGNIIGLDRTGTQELHNGFPGIIVEDSPNTIVGGGQAAARNVIGRNSGYGVEVSGNSAGTEIKRNLIGTDISGDVQMYNNPGGVEVDSPGVLIEQNVISGNNGEGIHVRGGGDGLTVRTNRIGVALSDSSDLGNLGVGILVDDGVTGVTIGGTGNGDGNIIAFSSVHGVKVVGGASGTSTVRILRNSIVANGDLGIELGNDGNPTPNDTDDVDTGSNGLQNFPELTGAMSGSLVVSGTLNSTPSRLFRVEFFSSPTCDASTYGEGRTFRGSVQLTTDTNGDIDFTVQSGATVPVGNFITATATDTVTGSTSEFSQCVPVTALPSPTPSPIGQTPGPTPIIIETPGPTVTPTEEPTPSPSPSPTASPTPAPTETPSTATATPLGSPGTPTQSPSPTPVPTANPTLRHGDNDCSGAVVGRDALFVFMFLAELEPAGFQNCFDVGQNLPPPWGDVDCDDDIDTDDAIAILLWMAGLQYEHQEPCPPIGDVIIIG